MKTLLCSSFFALFAFSAFAGEPGYEFKLLEVSAGDRSQLFGRSNKLKLEVVLVPAGEEAEYVMKREYAPGYLEPKLADVRPTGIRTVPAVDTKHQVKLDLGTYHLSKGESLSLEKGDLLETFFISDDSLQEIMQTSTEASKSFSSNHVKIKVRFKEVTGFDHIIEEQFFSLNGLDDVFDVLANKDLEEGRAEWLFGSKLYKEKTYARLEISRVEEEVSDSQLDSESSSVHNQERSHGKELERENNKTESKNSAIQQ